MNASCACLANPLADAMMPSGFCAFALPVSVDRARSVLSLPDGPNLLALERGTQSVVLFEDTDNDGIPDTKRAVATEDGLNHGLALFDGYLYASSDTTVYRWPWDSETLSAIGNSTSVINNINAAGNGGAPQGHWTRTLEFDSLGRLYVSVGSVGNVDADSFRSRIRRFNIGFTDPSNAPSAEELMSIEPSASPVPSSESSISMAPSTLPTTSSQPSATAMPSFLPTESSQPSSAPSVSNKPSSSTLPSNVPSTSLAPSGAPSPQVFPIDFLSGEVYADGIRNAVAMAHDANGVLWAADTGADNLKRDDLGGDITDDNPAEELIKIRQEGLHYGYPYCWTEYRLDEPYAQGRGTAYAWPSFLEDGTVTDDDCRTIYAQADVAMQAHSTPLGITFYNYKPPEELPSYCPGGAFPESMDGYVFIAFHGSWNRRVPTGYKLVYVAVDKVSGNPVGEPVDLLAHIPPNAQWGDGFRPVDVDFDECGRLLLSSDGARSNNYAGAKIVRVEYIAEQCEDAARAGETLSVPNEASSLASSDAASRYDYRLLASLFVGLAMLLSLGVVL